MRTITAMFDSRPDAENARFRLGEVGISADNVTIHDKTIMDRTDRSTSERDYELADDAQLEGSYGQRAGVASDGSGGTHRDALGNFVDNRTDKPVGADAGSDRNLLGDFVDSNGNRRGEEGHDHDRRAVADVDDDRSLWDRIKDFFSGDDDVYAEGLRRGGYLMTARVEDHDIERAIAILDEDGVVDLDERQASWRQDGWAGTSQRPQTDGATRVRTYERSDWPL